MRINKTALIINILLCAILLGDAFVFSPKVKTVVLTKLSSKKTVGTTMRLSADYWNYFVHTSDNCKYEVSENLYDSLKQNDTVQVVSSRLIGMPMSIHYHKVDEKNYSKIEQLHTQDSEIVGLIISIVLSIIVLLLELTSHTKGIKIYFPLYLLAIAVTAILLVFVIIEVSSV